MSAPVVVSASVRVQNPRSPACRLFVADIIALPQGFVVRRTQSDAASREIPAPAAIEGHRRAPVTLDEDGLCEDPTAVTVKVPRHVIELTLSAQASYVDEAAGIYIVPHDHLRVVTGCEDLRALRLPTQDKDLSEQEVLSGIRRYRDILQRQVDELTRQLNAYGVCQPVLPGGAAR